MIGEALRLLRAFHRTSQSQLAADLEISKSYLSEIESGKKKASLEMLQRYSTRFNVPLSSLFFFAEELDRYKPADRARRDVGIAALRLLNTIASGVSDESRHEETIPN